MCNIHVYQMTPRMTYHNASNPQVDDVLRQSSLQLQLAQSALASQDLADHRGDEASHCMVQQCSTTLTSTLTLGHL